MVAVVGEVVTILTSGFKAFAFNLGESLNYATAFLFYNLKDYNPIDGVIYGFEEGPFNFWNPFTVVALIFMGISLGIGLCKWVVNYLGDFGRS